MLMAIERTIDQTGATEADPDDLLRWYVIRAHAGAEWQLRKGLLNRGVETFLPWCIGDARRGRWTQGVVRAIFPGYLFVGLEPDQPFDVVTSTPGALYFVKIGERFLQMYRPAPDKAHPIQSLREQAADEYITSLGAKSKVARVKPGDWVAIPEPHALEGLPVQIETIDKRGNVGAVLGNVPITFKLAALTESSVRGR